jgi:hypothetical protein
MTELLPIIWRWNAAVTTIPSLLTPSEAAQIIHQRIVFDAQERLKNVLKRPG